MRHGSRISRLIGPDELGGTRGYFRCLHTKGKRKQWQGGETRNQRQDKGQLFLAEEGQDRSKGNTTSEGKGQQMPQKTCPEHRNGSRCTRSDACPNIHPKMPDRCFKCGARDPRAGQCPHEPTQKSKTGQAALAGITEESSESRDGDPEPTPTRHQLCPWRRLALVSVHMTTIRSTQGQHMCSCHPSGCLGRNTHAAPRSD